MSRLQQASSSVLAVWLLSACGGPGADAGPDAPPAAADSAADAATGELLLAAPPAGWQEQGAMQTPTLRMAEYAPPRVREDRLERLTFEAQSGDPLPDPIEFVRGIGRDLAERCDRFEETNISSGYENGYPTSVRLMTCAKLEDASFGEVVMAKAIQGTERFYVITRRLRSPPAEDDAQPLTAQEMAEWSAHLGAIRVCDTRAPDHPCPSAAAGAPVEP